MHRIKEIMEELEEYVKHEINSKGINHVDGKGMGEAVDMIKDCAEALYYYSCYEDIKDEKEEREKEWKESGEKYYPRKRNRMGQFTRRGYTPYMHMPEYMDAMEDMRDMDMGEGRMYYASVQPNTGHNTWVSSPSASRYGQSYDNYMSNRRNYTTTDPEHRKKRLEMLDSFADDLCRMGKEVVEDMTPEEKQAWKVKLNKMINM